MAIVTGKSYLAKSFANIEPAGPLTLPRLMFLISLGVLITVLHKSFHYPLRLPGHHGLEALALLTFGRLTCTHRWAATMVAFSSAVSGAALGVGHGMMAPVFAILPGLAIDAALLVLPGWRAQLYLVPVVAAVAHATKPLLRWVTTFFADLGFGSLKAGVLYPLSTHLLFGFAGSMIAVLLWRSWMKRVSHGDGRV